MPLLVGTDGVEKMSKSLGNYIGISEPPAEIYGKLMSISDELMWRGNPRDVKSGFAKEIVARFHGAAAADAAAADFEARFRRDEIPADIPEVAIAVKGDALALSQALKQAGLTASTSEALRLIEQGGVKVDGEKVSDKVRKLAKGTRSVIQVGKRKFARVTIT
jgi:tyrosyl-tRNA synthetase